MCRPCKQLRPYRQLPVPRSFRLALAGRANDKQVGVGACHSLNLPFAWTTLDLADSQKFTDAPYRLRGSARGLPASGSGMTSPSCC